MIIDMRKRTVGQMPVRGERGFTLTEIAIVLGIVGLILGAIWVAAAAVYNNLRTSKATTELLTITQNVRAMYATSGAVDPAANMIFGAGAGAQLTYIQAGVFPADMVTAAATAVNDPWNGNAAVVAFTATTANDSFIVAFDAVPQQPCINMVTQNTGTGRDPELVGISKAAGGTVPAGVNNPALFPVLPSAAQTTYCTVTVNPYQAIGFTFKLK